MLVEEKTSAIRRLVVLSKQTSEQLANKTLKSRYLITVKRFYLYSLFRRIIALKIACLFRRTSALNVTYLLSDNAANSGFLEGITIASIYNSFAAKELLLILNIDLIKSDIDFAKEFFLILFDCFFFVYFSYFLIRSNTKRFFAFV